MKYTKDLLEPLIKSSTTMSEVVRKLGHRTDTGFVTYLKKVAKKLNIDTNHFKSKNEQTYLRSANRRNLEDYYSNKFPIGSDKLKKRLFRENVKNKTCEKCGISKWLNEELTFHLHHIDLNHANNNLNNLMIVCPNCHSIFHKPKIAKKPHKLKKSSLRPLSRKVKRPDFLTLKKDLEDLSYSAVGRKYGVSDNAIRKWIKMYIKYQEK